MAIFAAFIFLLSFSLTFTKGPKDAPVAVRLDESDKSILASNSNQHRAIREPDRKLLKARLKMLTANPLISFYEASPRDPAACQVMGGQDTRQIVGVISPLKSPASDDPSPRHRSTTQLHPSFPLFVLSPFPSSLFPRVESLASFFNLRRRGRGRHTHAERACHAKRRPNREARVRFVRS